MHFLWFMSTTITSTDEENLMKETCLSLQTTAIKIND